MRTVLSILLFCLLLALALSAWGFWRGQRLADGLEARMGSAPGAARDDLPDAVRALAGRGLAAPGTRRARFSQEAEMVLRPGGPWSGITAEETVSVASPDVLWRAEMPFAGPVPKFRVVDAYVAGRGRLNVRIAGIVPVADARGSDTDRAEAMRYLAELPWTPDAILCNPRIAWKVLEDGRLRASLGPGTAVAFRLDAAGDVVEVTAQDRPATDAAGQPVTYDWRGTFADHAEIGGRRIPLTAEVGYVREGRYVPYFRGRITRYAVE